MYSLQNYRRLMEEAAEGFVEDVRCASQQQRVIDIHSIAGDMAFDVIAKSSMG